MRVGVSNADFLNLCSLHCPYKDVPFLCLSDSWMVGQMQAKAKTFFSIKF